MDNINVIRIGFSSPEFRIPEIDGEIDNPIDRSGGKFTCLVFINTDDQGLAVIKDLDTGLPKTSTGFQVITSVIIPVKVKQAKAFRDRADIGIRLFCDSDLRAGKLFSVVDSAKSRLSYHPIAFIIGEDGSVRYRLAIGPEGLDTQLLRDTISKLA
ncbi:MAG: redoxin domain-containing protein [candidate division Zixibacteria bacterium]|nr:redoxin domain-containing protein [candidate division Zixibacteria bacterium]